MAKRFLDTGFFKSPFVRGLDAPLKGLYLFIICDCDGSGIWAADFEIAGLYVGQKITVSQFNKSFVETGKAIDIKNGKYFFPDFIDHQYPSGLQSNNKAHNGFISELLKYQVIYETSEGIFKPLPSPSQGAKVMVMVKEEVMVPVKVIQGQSEKIKTDTYGLFEPLVKKWIEYKKSEHRETYKTQATLDEFVKKLIDYSGGDFQRAEKIIDNSIANRWKGIFPEKPNGKPEPKKEYHPDGTEMSEQERNLKGVLELIKQKYGNNGSNS